MIELSNEVKSDIREFISINIEEWKREARLESIYNKDYAGIDLTVATDDTGTQWNYQTGDNSFTGGCYGLPHWAVTQIDDDSDPDDVVDYLISELTELLPENR